KSADVDISEITTGDSTEKADTKRELTAKQINDEIKTISDKLLSEFKDNLEKKGFHDINVKAVTTATTDRYFTVEVIAYEAQADGYEERHYYTIDLSTGDRVELKGLFEPDSDYQTAIAGCIENQMREQMKADESIIYWLGDGLIDLNLAEMVNEAEFYINDKNELVISFDETEVGPASMGVVEFTIERAQLADILKQSHSLE
ncbi:MAG: RsiV family protein, partial [Emergencia sp.]